MGGNDAILLAYTFIGCILILISGGVYYIVIAIKGGLFIRIAARTRCYWQVFKYTFFPIKVTDDPIVRRAVNMLSKDESCSIVSSYMDKLSAKKRERSERMLSVIKTLKHR